jgi:hypothetical protein
MEPWIRSERSGHDRFILKRLYVRRCLAALAVARFAEADFISHEKPSRATFSCESLARGVDIGRLEWFRLRHQRLFSNLADRGLVIQLTGFSEATDAFSTDVAVNHSRAGRHSGWPCLATYAP